HTRQQQPAGGEGRPGPVDQGPQPETQGNQGIRAQGQVQQRRQGPQAPPLQVLQRPDEARVGHAQYHGNSQEPQRGRPRGGGRQRSRAHHRQRQQQDGQVVVPRDRG